jgi:hypothetical protein
MQEQTVVAMTVTTVFFCLTDGTTAWREADCGG